MSHHPESSLKYSLVPHYQQSPSSLACYDLGNFHLSQGPPFPPEGPLKAPGAEVPHYYLP